MSKIKESIVVAKREEEIVEKILSKLPDGYGNRKSGMAIGYDHALKDIKHILNNL